MTQADLAEKLKIDPATLSRAIKTNDIKISILSKIAEFLNCDIADFIDPKFTSVSEHQNNEIELLSTTIAELEAIRTLANMQSKYIKILELKLEL